MPEDIPTPPFTEEHSKDIIASSNEQAIKAIEAKIAESLGLINSVDKKALNESIEASRQKSLEAKLAGMEKYKFGLLAQGGVTQEEDALKVINYISSIAPEHVDSMIDNLRIYSADIFELPENKALKKEDRDNLQKAKEDRELIAKLFIWRMVEIGMTEYTPNDLEKIAVAAIKNPNQANAEFAWHEGQNTQMLIEDNLRRNEKLIRTA